MMITRDDHFSQEMQRCRDYITALEQERKKIQVFQRELPLSLELVQQAIETCKQQLSECNNLPAGHLSECSEQTTTSGDVVPVFEEFIPLKRIATSSSSQSDGGEEHEFDKIGKSDWLRSVQLWNQSPDLSPKEGSMKKLDEGKIDNGGFQPFKKDKSVENGGTTPPPPPPPLPESGGGSKKDDKDGNRKARRCWSPELHRRFLQALQQLGGSHVATPKQIRELMKVEGLTNDEVKSHLQKYRLHTRRPSPQNTTTTQTPQFVVVGGIWVPTEYTTMATTATSSPPKAASAGIYAPIASIPQLHKPLASNDGGSGSDAGRRSNSPATSSSTYVIGVTTSSDY